MEPQPTVRAIDAFEIEWAPDIPEAHAAMELSDVRGALRGIPVGLGLVGAGTLFIGAAMSFASDVPLIWVGLASSAIGLFVGFGAYRLFRSKRIVEASGLLLPQRWRVTPDDVTVSRNNVEVRCPWDSVVRLLLSDRVLMLQLAGSQAPNLFIARRVLSDKDLELLVEWSGMTPEHVV